MTDPLLPGEELHTWKEIATYLGISKREAQNREKSDGMPVHRLAGNKARVWALRVELDAWRTGVTAPRTNALASLVSEAPPSPVVVEDTGIRDGMPASPEHRLSRRTLLAGIGSAAAAVALGAARLLPWSPGSPLRAGLVGNTLSAWDGVDRELWKYGFTELLRDRKEDNGMLRIPARQTQVADLHGDGEAQVLFAAGFHSEADHLGDELYCFSSKGKLLWRYKPDIVVRFGDATFSGPWHISDMLIAPGPIRRKVIWLALEHHNWRPGAILAIDPEPSAALKFVNAGHIYALGRTSHGGRNLIVAGGVNNEYASAAFAVFDENSIPACSPQSRGTRFECVDGPKGEVDRYLLFPPSEITMASDQPYNQVISIDKVNGEFLIRTREIPGDSGAAIYRLSDTIDPMDVTFDNSWAAHHRRLSKEGKLDHGLRNCPQLKQPVQARRWDPRSGWTNLEIPVSASVRPDAYSA